MAVLKTSSLILMCQTLNLGADSILIEAAATSVNPIDWKVRSGARQKDFPLTLPAILGKDVSGVVRAVGPNIRTFKVGERVVAQADATYAELVAVERPRSPICPKACPDRLRCHSTRGSDR